MKTKSLQNAGLLGASLLAASSAMAANYVWDANSQLSPDQTTPPMTLVDTSTPEAPQLSGGVLTLQNDSNPENLYYTMSGVSLAMPPNLTVSTEMRYVSGSASNVNRTAALVAFSTIPFVGASLFIGTDEIFLGRAGVTRGAAASVDTDDGFHIYRIEVTGTSAGSSVQVFQDNVLRLSGDLYSDNLDFAPGAEILFGEASNFASGSSEWKSFIHNALSIPEPSSLLLLLPGVALGLRRRTHESAA